ncbi:coiled-coil domain-containing protein 106-like [Epinephelus moara]|uniref:coiled-coil domain-containing protein 106-like n=1 Tax=Epinephelus moara TaxID=300413 RepID=UPI00214EE5C9|nr:coiled-coil domain-containing protein 106-like [Epinephelus moara]
MKSSSSSSPSSSSSSSSLSFSSSSSSSSADRKKKKWKKTKKPAERPFGKRMTTPDQVGHRYKRILKTFQKTRSVSESLKRNGVDKTTFALMNIIAEVTIALEGEAYIPPPHDAGTTLQSYAKMLKELSKAPQK